MVLEEMKNSVRPGITTAELDEIAEKLIIKIEARPAFKGYNGFPSICTSINEEVVHGYPGLAKVKSGDIISIDAGDEKKLLWGSCRYFARWRCG